MPRLAQGAMSSATHAAANQQKQTTTVTERKRTFWEDFRDGAQAVSAGASAINSIADTANDVWDMYDKYKVRSAYDEMSKAYNEGGMDALRDNPKFQDYHHAQALGQIMKDRASSEKGQLEIRQNALKLGRQNYLDTRAALLPGLEAYKKGDMEGFNKSIVNASKISNLPYVITPNQDGSYGISFRSSEEGKFVDTGRKLSAEQVNQIGQEYLRGEIGVLGGLGMQVTPSNARQALLNARSYMASVDSNIQYRGIENHIPLYDSNGKHVGNAIKQVNINDGSLAPVYETYGANGKLLGTFSGEDLAQRGFTAGRSARAAGARGAGSRGGRGGGGGRNADAGNYVKAIFTNAAANQAMMSSGYFYDKKYNNYFKMVTDEMGEQKLDYMSPAPAELYQKAYGIGTGKAAYSNDPLGLRGQKQANEEGQKDKKDTEQDPLLHKVNKNKNRPHPSNWDEGYYPEDY